MVWIDGKLAWSLHERTGEVIGGGAVAYTVEAYDPSRRLLLLAFLVYFRDAR